MFQQFVGDAKQDFMKVIQKKKFKFDVNQKKKRYDVNEQKYRVQKLLDKLQKIRIKGI